MATNDNERDDNWPHKFYHCSLCYFWHPSGFTGDCRDDDNRFSDERVQLLYGQPNVGWLEVAE